MKSLMFDLLHLFYPQRCCLCDQNLVRGEKYVCFKCLNDLPLSRDNKRGINENIAFFAPGLPDSMAYSHYAFRKGSKIQKLIHYIKYKDAPHIAFYLGEMIARDLSRSGSPLCNCDMLVPVPLHREKYKERGYNQAEWIARGLSSVWGTDVETAGIKRVSNNLTQTHRESYERWDCDNIRFNVDKPENFVGKSLLLVDDVITTGTTIFSLAKALLIAQPASLNFFSICRTL